MPEWLVELGIGEIRAALVDNGEIIDARVELEGAILAGSILSARLVSTGTHGRNAVAVDQGGTEYLLPRGAARATQGATIAIEVTREAIPGAEPWKRPLAKLTDASPAIFPPLVERLNARLVAFPDAIPGWDDLLDQARAGFVTFAGGELRISATPAMTLIDIDGYLPADELAVIGAMEACRAIRRLDIGGSIGIDLPTVAGKVPRQKAAAAIDAELPQPFERTAVNGFGFVQIVRPRFRPSLLELSQDRPSFEARALLRSIAHEAPGGKRIAAHPSVSSVLYQHGAWLDALSRQVGGAIELRADGTLPISGAYAEAL